MSRHSCFTVQGKPFLAIGGQTHNSSSYRLPEMQQAIAAIHSFHGNAIATPIPWEVFEPEEGQFNEKFVTDLIDLARQEQLHICFLWFGSWKNACLQYTPAWFKRDPERFRHVRTRDGQVGDAVSPLCQAALEADAKAFRRLMQVIRDYDADVGTVYAIQVENEPGSVAGTTLDFSPESLKAFRAPVPVEVIAYARTHPDTPLHDVWKRNGSHGRGGWQTVFGRSAAELFTSYCIARYIDEVARQGKEEYDLFLYVNVWVSGLGWSIAGSDYPAGGCVPETVDVWRAAIHAIDTLAPDVYDPVRSHYFNFCRVYSREDWPLYIPESSAMNDNYAYMFHAVGNCGAIGMHVFAVEEMVDAAGNLLPEAENTAKSFEMLMAAAPLIQRYRGTGRMWTLCQEIYETTAHVDLDGYRVRVEYAHVGRPAMDYHHSAAVRALHAPTSKLPLGRAMIFQESDKVFYVVGDHVRLTFGPLPSLDGSIAMGHMQDVNILLNSSLLSIEEGRFEGDAFVGQRTRSGDEFTVWAMQDCGVIRVEMV